MQLTATYRSVLVIAVLAAIAEGLFAHEPKKLPTERRETRVRIDNFSATDQNGQRFEFSSLRGKVVVVTFAYTSCPDVCPLITAAARQVQAGLSNKERLGVQLLTVTTDPQIDTPKILTSYAERYNADFDTWLFLTGKETELRKIWKSFGVGVKRKSRGLVDHTPLTAIVDRDGTLRVAYLGASPNPQSVLADVRRLMSVH